MCVVSYVGDSYRDKWADKWPYLNLPYPDPKVSQPPPIINMNNEAIRKELDDLKKEVEEIKKFLTLAKEYDVRNNEPECHMDDKVEILKRVAALVGVTLEDIFPE